jgi:pyridoxine 5-phosphate synthase
VLRNSRTTGIPDVVHLARLALDAGAQGLTVHPRPDGRHIRLSDVLPLRKLAAERGVEFNIEGDPFHELPDLAREVRPDQCTLVPDDPAAPTSDHGWDLASEASRLEPLISGIREQVSGQAVHGSRGFGHARSEGRGCRPNRTLYGTLRPGVRYPGQEAVLKPTRARQAAWSAGLGSTPGMISTGKPTAFSACRPGVTSFIGTMH